MKIYFREESYSRGYVGLKIALGDISPLISPFSITLERKEGKPLSLKLVPKVRSEGWEDLIFQDSIHKEEVGKIKDLFKKELKPLMEKHGLFDNISEIKVK